MTSFSSSRRRMGWVRLEPALSTRSSSDSRPVGWYPATSAWRMPRWLWKPYSSERALDHGQASMVTVSMRVVQEIPEGDQRAETWIL